VVFVIGSLNLDFSIKTPRFPEVGETLTGGKFIISPGGKGLNQAIASARAGEKTYLICSVGKDIMWQQVFSHIRRERKIKVIPVFSRKNHTGCAFILLDESGNNKIVVAPGANLDLSFSEVRKRLKRFKPKHIIFQNELSEELVRNILKLKNELREAKFFFNPAPYKDFVKELADKPDFLIMNENEASLLFEKQILSENDGIKTLEYVKGDFKNNVIITLGEKGVVLLHNGIVEHLPAFQVDAVDTTAAGDTFVGYLSSAILRRKNIKDSVVFAQAASAICVSRYGASTSIPHLQEVENFLKKRKIKI
jgi:ribokinase